MCEKVFTFAAAIVSASLSEASLSCHFLFCHSPFLFLVTTPLLSYQQLTILPSPPQLLTLSLFFTPQGQELPLWSNLSHSSGVFLSGCAAKSPFFMNKMRAKVSCRSLSSPACSPQALPPGFVSLARGPAPSRGCSPLPACSVQCGRLADLAQLPVSLQPTVNPTWQKCRNAQVQKIGNAEIQSLVLAKFVGKIFPKLFPDCWVGQNRIKLQRGANAF